MMRRPLAAAAVISFVVAACSGAPSTPVDFCNQLASVACQRIFDCALGTAQNQYGTQDNCTSQFEVTFHCSSAQCPAGTTYNSSNAQSCIDDVNGEECTQIVTGTVPAICLATGPGDPCQ